MELAFYTSSGDSEEYLTEKLRIKADGNVGIGTTEPGAKLGVNGLIRALGCNLVMIRRMGQ
jgi:hypothetical protein